MYAHSSLCRVPLDKTTSKGLGRTAAVALVDPADNLAHSAARNVASIPVNTAAVSRSTQLEHRRAAAQQASTRVAAQAPSR